MEVGMYSKQTGGPRPGKRGLWRREYETGTPRPLPEEHSQSNTPSLKAWRGMPKKRVVILITPLLACISLKKIVFIYYVCRGAHGDQKGGLELQAVVSSPARILESQLGCSGQVARVFNR